MKRIIKVPKESHDLMVSGVRFKRDTEESPWEDGIAIGSDSGDVDVIVDFYGNVVPQPIWNYRRTHEYEPWMWFFASEK